MKIAVRYKKLRLYFFFGFGFVLFVLGKLIKRKDPAAAQEIKRLGRQIKKLLKDYKRRNGSFNLLEVESDGSCITVKL